jgi:Ni,Fe-hydrogenase III large subunit
MRIGEKAAWMDDKNERQQVEQLDLLPREGIDWSRAAATRRVWLEDIRGDHGARLEFLAEQGLRLIMTDPGPGGGETLHFFNPRDEETLHLRAGGDVSLLAGSCEYFPESARWMELLRGGGEEGREDDTPARFLARGGLLLEVGGGRVLRVYEACREHLQPVLHGTRAARAASVLEDEGRPQGIAMAMAFMQAVEDARGMKVTAAAMALRAVLLESARIRGHLAWMGEFATALARPRIAARCGGLARDVEKGMEEWLGESRELGWVVPGGVKEGFPLHGAAGMEESLNAAEERWDDISPGILSLPIPRWAERRLRGLDAEAEGSGWVGPMARAVGLEADVRREEPGVYALAEWESAEVTDGGGALRRMLAIRAGEVGSSLQFMRRVLDDPPELPLLAKRGRGGRGEGFGRCEGPEGEVCCHVETEKGRISRVAFSLPAELNRSAARCLTGARLDEVEIPSFMWESAKGPDRG